jgi:hypothetical protein
VCIAIKSVLCDITKYIHPYLSRTLITLIHYLKIFFLIVSCQSALTKHTDENRYDNILKLAHGDLRCWTDTFVGGKQFLLPSLEDIEITFESCSLSEEWDWQYFLQGLCTIMNLNSFIIDFQFCQR